MRTARSLKNESFVSGDGFGVDHGARGVWGLFRDESTARTHSGAALSPDLVVVGPCVQHGASPWFSVPFGCWAACLAGW